MSELKSRVKSLKVFSKKANLFIVILNDGNEYKIHSDFIIKYKIKKNQFIKKNILDKGIKHAEKEQIKNRILLLLSYRYRSKKELKQSCIERGFNIDNIELVINELEERNYVDEYKFTKMYAHHLIKNKRLGQFLVERKLKQHEIETQIINSIVPSLYKKFPSKSIIREIIIKKKKILSKSDKDKIKLINYLKRKGFHLDDINIAMNSHYHN